MILAIFSVLHGWVKLCVYLDLISAQALRCYTWKGGYSAPFVMEVSSRSRNNSSWCDSSPCPLPQGGAASTGLYFKSCEILRHLANAASVTESPSENNGLLKKKEEKTETPVLYFCSSLCVSVPVKDARCFFKHFAHSLFPAHPGLHTRVSVVDDITS